MARGIVALITIMMLLQAGAAETMAQVTLKGGVNLAKFVGADAGPAEEVLGLNAGFSFTLFSIGPVELVPELYYAEKGTRFSNRIGAFQQFSPESFDPDQPFDLEFNLAYIEVPLLLKVPLPLFRSQYITPYLAGGPVFAWRIDCSFKLDSQAVNTVEKCANSNFTDIESTFKEADRGFVISGGIDFDVPYIGRVNLDGRYVRGLERLKESGINDDIQNQSITLMLGYSIGF
jgi:hypothetical protein